MFHSDRIIHTAHLNDIETAMRPAKRPMRTGTGAGLRTAAATLTTLAGACLVLFGTGLMS